MKDSELEHIKTNYSVISSVPKDECWEVQVVSDELKYYEGRKIEPNLEHAYVNFFK